MAFIVTTVLMMVWAADSVGFTGFVSVVVSLVISMFVAMIVLGVVDSVIRFFQQVEGPVGTRSASTPSRPAASSLSSRAKKPLPSGPSNRPAAKPRRQKTLAELIRAYDTGLARRLKAFEKVAAARPDFTAEDRQSVLAKVEEMHHYHYTYQHIFNDNTHPDQAMVTREMRRYREAVSDLLRLRTDELQSGNYGGFEYRESVRTVEGHVELLRDEFEGFFEQLESYREPRRDPEETL